MEREHAQKVSIKKQERLGGIRGATLKSRSLRISGAAHFFWIKYF